MAKKRKKEEKEEENLLDYLSRLSYVTIYGKRYPRVRYDGSQGKSCQGCHAQINGLHQATCPYELCPACKGRSVACPCDPDVENAVKDNFIECLDNPL